MTEDKRGFQLFIKVTENTSNVQFKQNTVKGLNPIEV